MTIPPPARDSASRPRCATASPAPRSPAAGARGPSQDLAQKACAPAVAWTQRGCCICGSREGLAGGSVGAQCVRDGRRRICSCGSRPCGGVYLAISMGVSFIGSLVRDAYFRSWCLKCRTILSFSFSLLCCFEEMLVCWKISDVIKSGEMICRANYANAVA